MPPSFENSPRWRGPNLNMDHQAWVTQLRSRGVDVIDLTDLLWRVRLEPEPIFPATDSHWSHRGLRLAAREVADHLRPRLASLPPARPFRRVDATRTFAGDLAVNNDQFRHFPNVREQVECVVDATTGDRFQPGPEAPILLLGDSFGAIGIDQGSSFSYLLMADANVEVQSMAIVGARADVIRRPVARPGVLKSKRIVVLIFRIRALLAEPWNRMAAP